MSGGGVLDDALSMDSENGVKNRVIAEEAQRLEQLIQQENLLIQQANQLIQQIQESRATLDQFGLVKISGSDTVTEDNGLVLSAKEKNPAAPGTIASDISYAKSKINSLEQRIICNENIRDISEIFDYRTHDLALFSNWKNSPLCPKNYGMALRIPNLDAKNASFLYVYIDMAWVGHLAFATRTISWKQL